jgi:hypothetical protein
MCVLLRNIPCWILNPIRNPISFSLHWILSHRHLPIFVNALNLQLWNTLRIPRPSLSPVQARKFYSLLNFSGIFLWRSSLLHSSFSFGYSYNTSKKFSCQEPQTTNWTYFCEIWSLFCVCNLHSVTKLVCSDFGYRFGFRSSEQWTLIFQVVVDLLPRVVTGE